MNSKSNKDSALKCFAFFLISQPLVYLVQDIINHSNLFMTYYRFWFIWTICCLPMGYIGYYMKKDKWWGYLILFPMILFDATSYSAYLFKFMFSYPKYLLIVLFCISTMIFYPLYIFRDKKIRITGVLISSILIICITIYDIVNPPVYNTQILSSNEEHFFDNTYNVYLTDNKYGEVKIIYMDSIENYMIEANFKREGKTDLVIESPDGKKEEYKVSIKRDTYKVEKNK